MQVAYILFGALFTIATSFALGALLMRALSLNLFREEERLFAFIAGSGLLSLLVFCLAAAHVAYKGVFLAAGTLIIAAAIWRRAYQTSGKKLRRPPFGWAMLFGLVYVFFGALYFVGAMAPEHSPDGMTYHLGLVSRYYREHAIVPVTTNMYASLSQAMEMLFLFAFAFGRHSAAAMVHCAFLLVLPLLMLAWGRRFDLQIAAITGALLVYLSPVVGIAGTSAYNDVAATVVVFAVFYLLEIWSKQKDTRLLILIGFLAGYCYALKYTAGLAIPFAICWISWKGRSVRAVTITAACAAVLVVPWMVKDAVFVGNPVAPFGNKLFANPYIMPGDEASYANVFRLLNQEHLARVPLDVTVNGGPYGGLIGPAFLLVPLSLLALRWRQGRTLLLTAAVFTSIYFSNVSTRFLMLGLPFWSLALGMVLQQMPPAALILVIAHGLASWPPFIGKYADPYAWRLDRMATRPALRRVPEETYLAEKARAYILARMIEEHVPAGQRVFSFGGSIADAYTSREQLVSFQAAFNFRIDDILHTPIRPDIQPTRWLDYNFAPHATRKVRVVQTASDPFVYWSVAELRLYSQGHEFPRAPEWRLTAHPNPWTIQAAFDNSPATRWRSGEAMHPGMYVEVDLGKVESIDRVRVECSSEQSKVRMKVDVLDGSGNWNTVSTEPEESTAAAWAGLRRAATAEVKALGVSYILIEEGDFGAVDYIYKAPLWGWRQVDEKAGAHLFYIE